MNHTTDDRDETAVTLPATITVTRKAAKYRTLYAVGETETCALQAGHGIERRGPSFNFTRVENELDWHTGHVYIKVPNA